MCIENTTVLWHLKIKEGRHVMKRYSDILYWVKYRDMIHYDEKTDTVSYDPDLPERARISYEMWLKQDD